MTIRKVMNIALAVLLVSAVLFVGGVTAGRYYDSLGYAALVTYRQYLPENPNVFDNIAARIQSFTYTWNVELVEKVRMQHLNTRAQWAVGKRMVSLGGNMMVTTQTGHLYDLMDDTASTRAIRARTLNGLEQLQRKLSEQGIPLLYGYAHTTLYDGESLPDGITDDNNRVADEIVAALRNAGILTLDSRELMRASGLPLDEMIYRTDAHWSARNAFEMYARMVDLLNEHTSIQADRAAADISNFDITVLPGAHMSDLGGRLGPEVVAPDDFELITPKFDTSIHREIMKSKQLIPSDGRFEDVVLEPSMLPQSPDAPAQNCFNYYGQHPDVVYYTNPSAPEGRLLIVKDSFGTPVSSFMALAVRDVCAIDLRKTSKTVEDYVAEFAPDAVMFVQCQEVMREKNYVFVD